MYCSVNRLWQFILVSVVALATVAHADERSERLDREATTMYQQVFSPFCPGRSLNDCPSSKAAELKDEMRAKLDAGVSSEQILNDVFSKFGDKYRAVPPFAGVGMLVWVVPLGFVALGLIVALAVSMSRKKVASVASASSRATLSAEEERKIEEELSKLD